ncbi:hypothetical protein CEXT_102041 [Caerostris extrusa]|uniref:Uncharacterized protein n=1 Tax=Caerostris extrusa TaxID=172846 RepID=A0AAV4V3Z0_CAEEX|nr:hypothetical protein CEXT_102041 [Caerostris extrusa]
MPTTYCSSQFTLFVAVAVAEEMMAAESYPVASYHQGPALAASSAGHAYGAHGQHSRGYGAHGASNYGDHGRYADRAHAAHGHHNIGGHVPMMLMEPML